MDRPARGLRHLVPPGHPLPMSVPGCLPWGHFPWSPVSTSLCGVSTPSSLSAPLPLPPAPFTPGLTPDGLGVPGEGSGMAFPSVWPPQPQRPPHPPSPQGCILFQEINSVRSARQEFRGTQARSPQALGQEVAPQGLQSRSGGRSAVAMGGRQGHGQASRCQRPRGPRGLWVVRSSVTHRC